MRNPPNPPRKLPPSKTPRGHRKRTRRPVQPIMVTVQEVHCRACKRKFELIPDAPANFCIWCRSDNIQSNAKTRRETPAERKRREFEMNARIISAGLNLFAGIFGIPLNGHSQGSQISKPESTLEAELLKKGYQEMAKKYHPDKGGDPEKMKELNRLKEKLGL